MRRKEHILKPDDVLHAHAPAHPFNRSSGLRFLHSAGAQLQVLLSRERGQPQAEFGDARRTSVKKKNKKMRWEKKIAVDSPDGDSLAFSLRIECDVCVCRLRSITHLPAEAELSFISH